MFQRQYFYKVIITIVVTLLLFAPVQFTTLWWRETLNSGHALLFAFLAFIIYPQVKARVRTTNTLFIYLCTFAVGGLLSILIEILQTLVQRQPSLEDLYTDFFGLSAGLCWHLAWSLMNAQRKKIIGILLIVSGVGFFLLGVSPLLRLSWHYAERANAFPVVMDFASEWAPSFVHYDEGMYPGVSIIEPVSDWTAFHTLHLNVFSASQRDIQLTIRIHDTVHNQEYADRFNATLPVLPGDNDLQFSLRRIQSGPVLRQLDLKDIAGVVIFAHKQEEWSQIEVKTMVLE